MKCGVCGRRGNVALLGTATVAGCKVTRSVCSASCAESSDRQFGKVEAWRLVALDQKGAQ